MATSCPSLRMATLSLQSRSSLSRCETNTIALRCLTDRTSSCRNSISSEDRPAVGSSSRMIGSATPSSSASAKARMISTTCCTANGNASTGRVTSIQPWPKDLKQLAGAADRLRPPDQPAAREQRLVAEIDVLPHREVGQQREFLEHTKDAMAGGLVIGGEPRRRAADQDLPLGLRQRAGDDVQQRGLARSVLADEAEHLAAPHAQAHVVERAELVEATAEALHFQQHRASVLRHGGRHCERPVRRCPGRRRLAPACGSRRAGPF